jgi:hypothetical protein
MLRVVNVVSEEFAAYVQELDTLPAHSQRRIRQLVRGVVARSGPVRGVLVSASEQRERKASLTFPSLSPTDARG